jgi:hypothetical protein
LSRTWLLLTRSASTGTCQDPNQHSLMIDKREPGA